MSGNLPSEGWLKRKGFLGINSDRYCFILGSQFIVAKDQTKQNIEIILNITPSTKLQICTSDKTKPRFLISPPPYKTEAIFEANSYEQMMNWLLALRGLTFSNPDLNMDCFETISIIGEGYYGKVRLVKTKETNELFAIKSIGKSKLIAQKKVYTVLSERNIMAKASHPFIVSLKFAFQSPSKFYLGLEYVPGGELFHRIQKFGHLSKAEYRLIIAQVAIALHHLHSIGVVYRDIKPENILIAEDGYIKLTDFGLAKDLSVVDVTSTFCGTPEYIAPEVLKGFNYDKMVDWWALGILTYELIYHKTPFRAPHNGDNESNRAVLYSKIVQKEPKFPDDADPIEKDFILGLLTKDPHKRFEYSDIYNHNFFGDITFEDVLAKKITPEYVPELSSPFSLQNFDEKFTTESKAESYLAPVFGDDANVVGFSYTNRDFLNQISESESSDFQQKDSLLVSTPLE